MNQENYAALPAFAAVLARGSGKTWERRAGGIVVVTATAADSIVANGITLQAWPGTPCVLAAMWWPRFALDDGVVNEPLLLGDIVAIRFRPDLVTPFEVRVAGQPVHQGALGKLEPDGFAAVMRPDLRHIPELAFPAPQHEERRH